MPGPRRPMPPGLTVAFTAARRVEGAAETTGQRSDAIAATALLMRAAQDAGWRIADVAAALGITRDAARKRLEVSRRAQPNLPGGLLVPRARPRRPSPTDVLHLPVEEREWLTRDEALTAAGVSLKTLRNWRVNGLLPNTVQVHRTLFLYLRADVLRVARAPRYNNHGVNYQQLRAQLSTNTAGNDISRRPAP